MTMKIQMTVFVGETFQPILFMYHATINFVFLTYKLEIERERDRSGIPSLCIQTCHNIENSQLMIKEVCLLSTHLFNILYNFKFYGIATFFPTSYNTA